MSTEVNVGSLAPDFNLPTRDGGRVALVEYKGRSAVVLFFVREFN
jgi:peroxiredoxin